MSKSLLGGGAFAALFSTTLIFYAVPSSAEPLAQSARKLTSQAVATSDEPPAGKSKPSAAAEAALTNDQNSRTDSQLVRRLNSTEIQGSRQSAVAPIQSFTATAYSLRGRTASGRHVTRGIIAADRRVLPLGTRVRLDAGPYSGEYLVADTGGAVRGRKIDIWVPSGREAVRFGRRKVKLTVLTRERNAPSRRAPAARP